MSMEDRTAAQPQPGAAAIAAHSRPSRERQTTAGRPASLHGSKPFSYAVRQSARSALVLGSLPTSRARMLPNFLIVGAQRCGTTSMGRTLCEHPAVSCAMLDQEVHYFDNAYRRGLAWYRSHFPLSAVARRAARAAGAAPAAFESSPYYMFHPLAPERIAHDLPDVRLLILLRDPVERAYSAHAHEVALGHETEPFERALELEAARLNGQEKRIVAEPGYYSYSHQHHAYRARGQYVEQVERLERVFGRDRLLVIDSGHFFADPESAYDRVLDFLALPNRGYPAFKQRNAQPRSPMPDSVRAALDEHFRPYDERLAAWLGWEPSWRCGR